MAKAPAFQLYVNDYIRDTRMLSLEAKGAWSDCLCFMWNAEERGLLNYSVAQYARIWGCTEGVANGILDEFRDTGIADVATDGHGNVTLINRRMSREESEREGARIRKQKSRSRTLIEPKETDSGRTRESESRPSHGDVTAQSPPQSRTSHKDVTPYSSSSTSSSVKKTKSKKGRSRVTADGVLADLKPPDKLASSTPFAESWAKWVHARMAKPKPRDWIDFFGDQLEWLNDFTAAEAVEILNKSILGGYQGLFPPNNSQPKQNGNHSRPNRDAGTLNEGRVFKAADSDPNIDPSDPFGERARSRVEH